MNCSMRSRHKLHDAIWAERNFVDSHREWQQRIRQSVGNRCRWRDGTTLTESFDAQRIER